MDVRQKSTIAPDLAAVFTGGMIGTALRMGLDAWLSNEIPIGIFLANILGAFALGFLLESLGPSSPRLRLFAGTGLLGSFTTYSALAVGTLQLADGSMITGVGYAGLTLVCGFLAALAGISAGRRKP